MPCVWSGTSCTVSVEPGLPSTGMVLELACLGFAGGRGTSVGGVPMFGRPRPSGPTKHGNGEAMAAGVAVRIFVWIRRLAYRIDGARLGIVRCWGLAAVGGLGLICWLACCFFRWKGLSCFFLVPRYLLFSGFLLFFRYLITKISVILSMST